MQIFGKFVMYFPSTIKNKKKIWASIRPAEFSLLSNQKKKKNAQNPIISQ